MDLSLFQYTYPKELIAQHPLPERDASRMMVLDRMQQSWRHESVQRLPEYLRAGDLLVLNDTKVFPARLMGEENSGRRVEILLLESLNGNGLWRGLAKPLKKINIGDRIVFAPGFNGTVVEKTLDDVVVQLESKNLEHDIQTVGLPPLPPYIRRKSAADYTPEDKERYQSIFARCNGSSAAPTASLHFSEALLQTLEAQGVPTAFVTLHVSIDTFLPIREPDITQHKMHGEQFRVPQKTRDAIRKTKEAGGRVIAVGTTVVRALESNWDQSVTHHYIYPGYRFKVVDGIVTNFHQPGSTLIAMIAAFVGRTLLLQAYQEAVEKNYRLFSFGDCMLCL